MVDQYTDAPAQAGDDLASAGDRLERERQSLSQTASEARDAVIGEAKDLGDQAATQIGAGAERARDEATAGLSAFSDALKDASAQLSGKEFGFAGDLVKQAAGGLESLARSLEGRSPGEMLEDIRAFGRQNPVGFIAGSVLAGFALGRVASALPSAANSGANSPADLGAKTSGGTPDTFREQPTSFEPGTAAAPPASSWEAGR